jgi:hypothetical protein
MVFGHVRNSSATKKAATNASGQRYPPTSHDGSGFGQALSARRSGENKFAQQMKRHSYLGILTD